VAKTFHSGRNFYLLVFATCNFIIIFTKAATAAYFAVGGNKGKKKD
jgi:hypothetical protein